MEAMRTRWTDERIDDLKATVDDGFKRVEGRLDRVEGRIASLEHAMILCVVALCTMMFAGFGALITLFATHF